jgi:hypothetical protein
LALARELSWMTMNSGFCAPSFMRPVTDFIV